MPDQNPFAPPQTEQSPAAVPDIEIDKDMVRRFRSESLALAAFWVFMGFGCVALGAFLWPNRGTPNTLSEFLSIALTLIGVALFVLGLFAGFRVMRAIRAAFWLTLVLLLIPPIWISVFGIALTLLAILQTRRVIRWANALEAANLPLNIRPHQVLSYRLQQQNAGSN